MKQPIRTRFAPSPTGFLHVGGIHTALCDFLVARRAGGQFILRIEDTDRQRLVAGAEQHIIDSLRALGLDYDEGPDIGGPHGPYRQSERLEVYKLWAEKLINSGRAYPEVYKPAEIQAFREQATATKKPFLYRNHRPQNPPIWDGSQPLRFKSEPKKYHWHDLIMGDLSAGAEAVDDFIIMKSDGYPTYNFAHIVDDADMEISHIIRGQEFIASTPNYLNLYEALGLTPPSFASMPPILAPAGNRKLSKRDGAKDVLEYLRDGYLVEALVNFIAKIGWNDGSQQEIYSLDELIANFSLERVPRAGARFDERKLLWLNTQWIKRLSLEELESRVGGASSTGDTRGGRLGLAASSAPSGASGELAAGISTFWGPNGLKATPEQRQAVLKLVQDRLKTLVDLPSLSEYFFARPSPNWAMVDTNKQLSKLSREDQKSLLRTANEELAKIAPTDWKAANLQSKLNDLLELTDSKPPILFGLIRLALTWAPFSPALPETMELLGKNETLARLNNI